MERQPVDKQPRFFEIATEQLQGQPGTRQRNPLTENEWNAIFAEYKRTT
jgi:hypothetical protein